MNNPDDAKLYRLARLLLQKTQGGSIHWERTTPAYEPVEAYDYSSTNSTITVVNDGNNGDPRMYVRNSEGLEIAEMAISNVTPEEVDQLLFGLHETIRRQVLGIDQTLDELIAEVESHEDPPF